MTTCAYDTSRICSCGDSFDCPHKETRLKASDAAVLSDVCGSAKLTYAYPAFSWPEIQRLITAVRRDELGQFEAQFGLLESEAASKTADDPIWAAAFLSPDMAFTPEEQVILNDLLSENVEPARA